MNTYPKNKSYDMYTKRLLPGHNLFGTQELKNEYNMEVIIPKQERKSILNKIGDWFDIGLLDQQIQVILMSSKWDIIYAPYAAANTKLIMLGKLFGFIRKPVVILVHTRLFGKPSKHKWIRSLVKRLILTYDSLIFFSQKMRNELMEDYAINSDFAEKHFILSPLGVDMTFFDKYSNKNVPETKRFAISSGNSARDFDILIRASERVGIPLKIYCKPESFPKSPTIPKSVEILSGEFPFEQICKDYDDSRVVLIPLAANPEGPIGLTSLLEAFAMGKPVIMTRNDYIDVDFQHEKIGLVVEPNDVDGWVRAISTILNDYPLLKEMGENSLRLGSEKLNINVFARDLASALINTYQRYISKDKL